MFGGIKRSRPTKPVARHKKAPTLYYYGLNKFNHITSAPNHAPDPLRLMPAYKTL